MTNKLSKEKLAEAKEVSDELKNDYAIITAVNTSEPTEEAKRNFYQLLKEKPDFLDRMTSLIESNQEYFLSQNCSFLLAEKLKTQIKKMRDSLGYATSSEMEKLLIEQVCINWLRVNLLEKTHAVKTYESHTQETGLYWDKRLNSAQRRYLRACESLAKVRKLLAEAELKGQQARNKRSKSAAIAQQILKNATS